MTMTIVPLGEPVPATFDRRVSPLNVCLCTLVMHYAEVAGSSLARALLDLTQRSAGPYEMSLGELRQCLVRRGLSDAEEYLSDIVGGVQYPDDIVDLFADFDRTINISTSENEYSSPIHRASPFGVFLREIVLAFNLLPFSGVARLFDEFVAFCAQDSGKPKPATRLLSQYVHEQIAAIQASIGHASYGDTEDMIGNLLAAGCADAIPQIHYLRFLNCMYHKEFAGAVASLHRFFDRSGLLGGSSPQNQYALLSLSVLHYTFNNTLLAKQALNECTRIALQYNDSNCLLRALSMASAIEMDSCQSEKATRLLLRSVYQVIVDGVHNPNRAAIASLDAENFLNVASHLLQGGDACNVDFKVVWDRLHSSLLCLDNLSHADPEHYLVQTKQDGVRSAIWRAISNRALESIYQDRQRNRVPTDTQVHSLNATCSKSAPFETDFCRVRRRVEDLLDARSFSNALAVADSLREQCNRRRELSLQAGASLMCIHIHHRARAALQYVHFLLQCGCIATHMQSLTLNLLGAINTAMVHLSMDAPELALRLLKGAMPDILEQLPPDDKARAFILVAKCYIRLSLQASSASAFDRAVQVLAAARQWSDAPRQMEIAYYLALVWHHLGRRDKRDRYAAEFNQLRALSCR
ncbi:Anaphase-promoting complex subunit 5 [Plasmodiophora brassicae]